MYCCDVHCAEYSTTKINKRNFCDECYDNYIETCKLIQGVFRKKQVKNLLNPSNILEKVYLTEDEKVIKYILKYGTDELPKKGEIIKAHYIGKLLDNTKFDSSYNRNKPIDFVLGENKVIKMWELAFASMKKGEKAIIIGSSDYGYGINGSPPIIPSDASLHFELELIDFKTQQKDILKMSYDEKIEKMMEYKNKGIISFNNKDICDASNNFIKSLEYLCDEKHEEKINILNNLSICMGKLNDWNNSLIYSMDAFKINNSNIKVLYRVALSYFELKEYDKCIEICKMSIELENSNIINVLYKKCVKYKNNELSKVKKMYSKMF
tara:strand:- start:72 stop:1040 length:969 start_codon:yes stop_codon:yes gene_type:complete